MPTALRGHVRRVKIRELSTKSRFKGMRYRKACKRYSDPGHAHALTFSCFQRQAFLSKDRSRLWFTDALDRAREKHRFHLWAYVIMPEHAHILIWPTGSEYKISDILSSLKQSVAKRALLYVRREAPTFLSHMADKQPNGDLHYRFWQRGGGYDRNVVEPLVAFQQIEYMHQNPVRRGLSARAEDWLWSSAADYARLRVGPLRLDAESLPVIVRS
jgi:putative transposase